MKNNIKNILKEKELSILQLQKNMAGKGGDYGYNAVYSLVNRNDLSNTKLGTLKLVSHILNVDIKELWK